MTTMDNDDVRLKWWRMSEDGLQRILVEDDAYMTKSVILWTFVMKNWVNERDKALHDWYKV